jgi:hypothetical protein
MRHEEYHVGRHCGIIIGDRNDSPLPPPATTNCTQRPLDVKVVWWEEVDNDPRACALLPQETLPPQRVPAHLLEGGR